MLHPPPGVKMNYIPSFPEFGMICLATWEISILAYGVIRGLGQVDQLPRDATFCTKVCTVVRSVGSVHPEAFEFAIEMVRRRVLGHIQ